MNKTFLHIGLIVLAIACMVFIVMLRLATAELTGAQLILGRVAAIVMGGIFIYFSYSELQQAKAKDTAISSRLVSGIRVPMYIFAGAFMVYVSYAGI